ncbi:helix-turn-helix transcriptional regulator [uncultured Clostridium sp.]|uniref:helix-turn-helix transcriptional regulator n=1 Tax=uncultured Clostridium sp. TaxID=59620 RepID=UPI00261742BB|nr:helix-turn-helix transcriptional regulator [uncultured Clostridium sp.]
MKEEFKDRLRSYRDSLNIDTQTKMAKELNITRQLYSNLESGYKNPSDRVIDILVKHSNRPAVYWIYGLNPKDYIDDRREFKCLYEVVENLKDTENLELNCFGEWSKEVEEMLISALKADITHLLLKNKKDS